MEGIASDWIAAYAVLQGSVNNLWLSANSYETNDLMNDVFACRSLMLPNTYIKPDKPSKLPTKFLFCSRKKMHIACFGAIRPLKNHYAQGAAAIMYGNKHGIKIDFHVNKGREEQGGDRVTKNLRSMFQASHGHNLIEHSWYPHDELVYDILPQMDIGMQVSLTETFNIVAADMVSAGVPTVGSSDIYWMSSLLHADPNNLDDMVKKIERAKALGKFGVWLNKQGLRRTNNDALSVWKKGLDKTSVKK
jgi:hypothetical protein